MSEVTTQALIAFLERIEPDFPQWPELRAAADALRSLPPPEEPTRAWLLKRCEEYSAIVDSLRAEVARLTQARDTRLVQGEQTDGMIVLRPEIYAAIGKTLVAVLKERDRFKRMFEGAADTLERLQSESPLLAAEGALEPLRQVLADWTFQLESAERFNTDVAHVVKVATLRQCLSDVHAGIGTAAEAVRSLPPTAPPSLPGNWHEIDGPNGMCKCGTVEGRCPERLQRHIQGEVARLAPPPESPNVTINDVGDAVCQHGRAMDVHCCHCHSGFIFDKDHVCHDDSDPECECEQCGSDENDDGSARCQTARADTAESAVARDTPAYKVIKVLTTPTVWMVRGQDRHGNWVRNVAMVYDEQLAQQLHVGALGPLPPQRWPATLPLPEIELVASRVHDAWMDQKRAQGITSSLSQQTGEEQMRPYAALSDAVQEYDRATVRAVYAAIAAVNWAGPLPSPQEAR